LDAFSYSVSHDLLNPVGVVNGFASLLRRELATTASPKVSKYLDHIGAASQRMTELIEDLLALARASRAEPARSPIDVRAIALDLRASFSEQRRGHPVDLQIQPGLSTCS